MFSELLPNVTAEIDTIVKTSQKDINGIYAGLEFMNQTFDYKALRDNLAGIIILQVATRVGTRQSL